MYTARNCSMNETKGRRLGHDGLQACYSRDDAKSEPMPFKIRNVPNRNLMISPMVRPARGVAKNPSGISIQPAPAASITIESFFIESVCYSTARIRVYMKHRQEAIKVAIGSQI